MQTNKQLANKIKTKAYKDLSEQTQVLMTRLKDSADDDKAFIDVLFEIDLALELSDFFETKLYKDIKRNKLNEVTSDKINSYSEQLDEADLAEFVDSISVVIDTQTKLIKKLKKRIYDCISRHSDVEKSILHAVMMLETLSYEQLDDSQHDKILHTIKNAEVNNILSQLDLINLYALEKYYPVPEARVIIEAYKLETTEFFELWQSANNKYKQAQGVSIYDLDVEQPLIASKVYERRAELVDTREKFIKNIDGYGGQFINDDEILNPVEKGGLA